MATLPELRPNGDVSTTTSIPWTNQGGDTLMWQAIDDDPDSPDAADYADSSAALYAGTAVLELTSSPADFASMDTVSIAGFFMKTGAKVDDDVTYDKMLSNIGEVKARGSPVIALAEEDDMEIEKHADIEAHNG